MNATAVVSGMTGPTGVRSVSGDVTLDGITADVTAETVFGNLDAASLTGDLHFKTVSGDLTVAGGGGHRVRAKSVSGDVTLDVELTGDGELRADTVSGDVMLRFGDVSAAVDVISVSGRLTSAYDGLQHGRGAAKQTLTGTIGSGAGQVRVRTVSGDVALLSRDLVEPAAP